MILSQPPSPPAQEDDDDCFWDDFLGGAIAIGGGWWRWGWMGKGWEANTMGPGKQENVGLLFYYEAPPEVAASRCYPWTLAFGP